MTIFDIPIHTLDGDATTLAPYRASTLLLVNVASRCGLTPQYEGLEKFQRNLSERGFSVLGFPCNQFMEQEPGSAEEIKTFCSTTYGVTFPMFEKIDVNGEDRHPIYDVLCAVSDAEGYSGDIRWNFEKFLFSPNGKIERFAPTITPEDPVLVSAIESSLALG